ncbi:MAG: matrixin family metalloprotease [Halolamina sp.]
MKNRSNPWNESELVVAVDADATGDRAVGRLVRKAAAFWSNQSRRYAGYPVAFSVQPNAENPDIVIRFTDEVGKCGYAATAAGCAPYINSSAAIDRPVVIDVRTGFDDASTAHIVRHELGHLLGIEHGEPPTDVMRPDVELETLPRPNATDRVFPWPDTSFNVYLDLSAAPNEAAARKQVQHALAYYERGLEGMPDNLTFTVVDDPSKADISIHYRESASCNGEPNTCFRSRGPDPDGDDAIEEYRHVNITVYGTDTEAIGWYVGSRLAYAFGAEEEGQRPEPFGHATPVERRSNWWEE